MRPAISFTQKKLGNNLIGAEIGVDAGNNARIVLDSGLTKTLYLIDIWKSSNKGQISISFSNFLHSFMEETDVVIVRAESVLAANMIKDGFFDFVYIDADHSEQGVKEDLEAWFDKVRIGGIFCGHDYNQNGCDGVKISVDSFALNNGLIVQTEGTDWWIEK